MDGRHSPDQDVLVLVRRWAEDLLDKVQQVIGGNILEHIPPGDRNDTCDRSTDLACIATTGL